jgi:hypothetical protein
MPANALFRARPLIPVRLIGPSGFRDFHQTLADSGAVDSVFPDDLVDLLSVVVIPSGVNQLRWRGQAYSMRYGQVQLQLTDGVSLLTLPTVVAFSTAPMAYPVLGHSGCLQFFDASFLGAAPELLLQVNAYFPGVVT